LYIRNSAPQDLGEQRPLRVGPIGQDRRRGDAHIGGYYVLVYADTTAQEKRPGEGLGHRGGAMLNFREWRVGELAEFTFMRSW
jgi:hypothetical protein